MIPELTDTPVGRIWSLIKNAPPSWLALLFALLTLLTLLKMRRVLIIRGFFTGRTEHPVTVTQRWQQRLPKEIWWISWTQDDIQKPGPHRCNVSATHYERLKPGTPITLIQAPGERGFYLEDGIYASTSNLAFDGLLLIGELLGLGYFTVLCFL